MLDNIVVIILQCIGIYQIIMFISSTYTMLCVSYTSAQLEEKRNFENNQKKHKSRGKAELWVWRRAGRAWISGRSEWWPELNVVPTRGMWGRGRNGG